MIVQKASPVDGLEMMSIERGPALLTAHTARVANIRSMIGVPQQHWRLLYQPLFFAFAELVQHLPVSEGTHQREHGDLLQHALEIAELALKLRRGHVLPPAKEPEAVAEEQDVWTYAVVTAALLHDVGAMLTDQCVTLYGRNHLPIAVWSPWIGPMTHTAAKRYRTEVRRRNDNGLHRAVTPLIVSYVVPVDGLRWLGCHPDAFAAWLCAISCYSSTCTIVAKLISQADQIATVRKRLGLSRQLANRGFDAPAQHNVSSADRVKAEPTKAPGERKDVEQAAGTVDAKAPAPDEVAPGTDAPPTENGKAKRMDANRIEEAADPGAAFVTWLISGLRSGALAINTPTARAHVVDEGLLLVSPAVFRAFAGDQWRETQKRFLKRSLTERTAEGQNFFHYVLETSGGRKTIKGVLIRNAEAKLAVTLPTINQKLARKSDAN